MNPRPCYPTAAEARAAALTSGQLETCAWASDNWKFLFERAEFSRRWTDGTTYAGEVDGRRWAVRLLRRSPANLAPPEPSAEPAPYAIPPRNLPPCP
jgi:hypothetical protein